MNMNNYEFLQSKMPNTVEEGWQWIRINNVVFADRGMWMLAKNIKYTYPDNGLHLTLFVHPDAADYDRLEIYKELERWSNKKYYVYKNTGGMKSIPSIEHWHIVEDYEYWKANFA